MYHYGYSRIHEFLCHITKTIGCNTRTPVLMLLGVVPLSAHFVALYSHTCCLGARLGPCLCIEEQYCRRIAPGWLSEYGRVFGCKDYSITRTASARLVKDKAHFAPNNRAGWQGERSCCSSTDDGQE